MMDVKCNGRQLTINGNRLDFEHSVDEVVTLDDRVIVRFLVGDYAVGDYEVGRNVACYGLDGRMLWKIEPTGGLRSSRHGGMIPEAFFNLAQDEETGEVTISTPDCYTFTLDPETGYYFNPVFTK